MSLMKLIDSNDPKQMTAERIELNWEDMLYLAGFITFLLYFLGHRKEVISFFNSVISNCTSAVQEYWLIALVLFFVISGVIYLSFKAIQFIHFIIRFFTLICKALDKYVKS